MPKGRGERKGKDFNQRFVCILNKFVVDMKLYDSITIDYYTSTPPTSIVQFIKRAIKPTVLENCEEKIVVENDLCAIGIIKDDEPTKDPREVSKKPQATVSKGKDRETSDIENLTCLVKNMAIEVSELKQ